MRRCSFYWPVLVFVCLFVCVCMSAAEGENGNMKVCDLYQLFLFVAEETFLFLSFAFSESLKERLKV